MGKNCKAKKRNGARCEAWAGASGYCMTHDPARAKDRAERNRRGGLAQLAKKATNGIAPPRIESMADVLALLNFTIADLWELENTVPRARGLLAAVDSGIKSLQAGELGDRVAALEAALAARKAD